MILDWRNDLRVIGLVRFDGRWERVCVSPTLECIIEVGEGAGDDGEGWFQW